MLNVVTLSYRTKLLRSAILALAFFMPMLWLYAQFGHPATIELMVFAVLECAAVSFVSAYLVTMYVELWRPVATQSNDTSS